MNMKERINNTGLKCNFIAKYIDVSPAMISKIIKGTAIASQVKMDLLEELLEKIENLGL